EDFGPDRLGLIGVAQAAAGAVWQFGDLGQFAAEGRVDLDPAVDGPAGGIEDRSQVALTQFQPGDEYRQIGRASCRDRGASGAGGGPVPKIAARMRAGGHEVW